MAELDGLRRLVSAITLVVVLFTGVAPFDTPPANRTAMLAVGIALLSIGHWLLSGGNVRPVARLIWSMASIGAGLGDGVSRSGLPIRWAMTMATLIALNISIALRGMSNRWTHGLGPMNNDARDCDDGCFRLGRRRWHRDAPDAATRTRSLRRHETLGRVIGAPSDDRADTCRRRDWLRYRVGAC